MARGTDVGTATVIVLKAARIAAKGRATIIAGVDASHKISGRIVRWACHSRQAEGLIGKPESIQQRWLCSGFPIPLRASGMTFWRF
jgi:hypothetical protein